MKIVVFSDVHGQKHIIEKIIRFNPDADYFLSLGDTEVSHDYLLDLDIIAVKGNYPRDPGLAYEHFITFKGVKLFLTHGHKLGVHRSLKKVMKVAFQNDVNIALYGHTHIAKVDKAHNLVMINPGSCYRPRNTLPPTYIILSINDDSKYTYTFKSAETNETIEF